jgi:hypothetical protein
MHNSRRQPSKLHPPHHGVVALHHHHPPSSQRRHHHPSCQWGRAAAPANGYYLRSLAAERAPSLLLTAAQQLVHPAAAPPTGMMDLAGGEPCPHNTRCRSISISSRCSCSGQSRSCTTWKRSRLMSFLCRTAVILALWWSAWRDALQQPWHCCSHCAPVASAELGAAHFKGNNCSVQHIALLAFTQQVGKLLALRSVTRAQAQMRHLRGKRAQCGAYLSYYLISSNLTRDSDFSWSRT